MDVVVVVADADHLAHGKLAARVAMRVPSVEAALAMSHCRRLRSIDSAAALGLTPPPPQSPVRLERMGTGGGVTGESMVGGSRGVRHTVDR